MLKRLPLLLGTALVAVAAGWLRMTLVTIPAVCFGHAPAAYVATNLLRHVDTPLASMRTVLALTALSATPFLAIEEGLDLLHSALHGLRMMAMYDATPHESDGVGNDGGDNGNDDGADG